MTSLGQSRLTDPQVQFTASNTLMTMCALASAGASAHAHSVSVVTTANQTNAPTITVADLHMQAALSVHFDHPYKAAPAAPTVVSARQTGRNNRVGSLTVGKNADFLVTAGDLFAPRVPPSNHYIEGQLIHRLGDVR